jgi:hypothetical protein
LKLVEIKNMLGNNYKQSIKDFFLKALEETYKSSLEFNKYYKGGKFIVDAGIDLLNYKINKKFQLFLTSPPYGLAHEYIRSVKLELAWLGLKDKELTELINNEIPYRKRTIDLKIESKTLQKNITQVKPKLMKTCEDYFKSILYIFEKVMAKLTPGGFGAIFIGNATFSGVKMPFHQIFREHLETRGVTFECLLKDKIKSRRLFKGRKNLSPDGIASEYLLVLKKE